ncbi:MAG: PEP-CTERM sorting domain-containing protein [bacterium]
MAPTEVGSPEVIPTPGAAALLGLGAMGMARRNRRSVR